MPQVEPLTMAGSNRAANYVLALLAITWVVAYLDRKIIAILVPDLKRDLLLTDVQASLVQGVAFAVLFVIAGLPIGRLVDKYNRRNIVIFGVLCWSTMTILCGFTRSYESLFVTRMFVGLGEACLAPAAASMVADCFVPEKRGKAMGAMLMGGAVGTALSAFLAGAVLERFAAGGSGILQGFSAWQITFMVAGLPGLVLAPALLTLREPERITRIGTATSSVSLLAVFKAKWRLLVPLYIAFLANMVATFGTSAWLPTMLIRDYAMSPAQVGVILGTLLLGMGLVSPVLGGWASDQAAKRDARYGRLILVAAAFVIQFAIGILLLLLLGLTPTLALLAFNALSGSCLAASAMVVLQEFSADTVRGQIIALYLLLVNVLGVGLGPLFVALLTDHVFADETMVRQSVATTFVVTGFLGLVMATLALSVYRKQLANADTQRINQQVVG